MYYVVHVHAGDETKAEEMIRRVVPEACYTRCFHPKKEMQRKIRGERKPVWERMLPGYIFIETEDPTTLYKALHRVHIFHRMLGKEGEGDSQYFQPLAGEDLKWLNQIHALAEDAAVKVTRVKVSKDPDTGENAVMILEGPLQNFTGTITDYDLHSRKAKINVEFMGATTEIHLGIEILGEKESTDA